MEHQADMNDTIREKIKKINAGGRTAFDEPMDRHCTFRCGGPADAWVQPTDGETLRNLLAFARGEGLETLVLGGGANILPADSGIRGLVIHTGGLATRRREGMRIHAGAGVPVSSLAAWTARQGMGGLEFLYAMPGSTGGAVFMNARCYDGEVLQVLEEVDYLDGDLECRTLKPEDHHFAYKDTPFMHNPWVILEARFRLSEADPAALEVRMKELEADRRAKGHFAFPCAGSVFKNNRDFGAPSGKIIDSLGLRGFSRGAAQISEAHANIMVNTGGARSQDLRDLMDQVALRVREATGFVLEPEIIPVGDWGHRGGNAP